ncbi:MAG: DUF2971 domain-containing protein, partial [Clostridia bacterium]|nr:DUF2971 domain-containing protein [Clostridia bacterium]
MAIITDELHSKGIDVLHKMSGEKVLFRHPDFLQEKRLYRYRSRIIRAVEEICTGNIYLSESNKQNDPFDGSYALTDEAFLNEKYPIEFLYSYISIKFALPENYRSLWEKVSGISFSQDISVKNFILYFSELVKKPKGYIFHFLKMFLDVGNRRNNETYKIACFSETKASIPMWAYYANNHKGVCLEYDLSRLDSNNEDENELKKAFYKIYYSDCRPTEGQKDSAFVVKGLQWAHEQEWRLICDTPDKYINVPCLSAVYLGINCAHSNFYRIVKAI